MAKWTKEQRLLSLMEYINWRGVPNWTDIKTAVQDKEYVPFRQWLRHSFRYIAEDRVRDVLEQFYFDHAEIDNSKGTAVYLKAGKIALYAIYQKDQEYGKMESV